MVTGYLMVEKIDNKIVLKNHNKVVVALGTQIKKKCYRS